MELNAESLTANSVASVACGVVGRNQFAVLAKNGNVFVMGAEWGRYQQHPVDWELCWATSNRTLPLRLLFDAGRAFFPNTTVHQCGHCGNNDTTIHGPHASRPTSNQPGKQRSKSGPRPTNWRPSPRTRRDTMVRDQPIDINELHKTPGPPGERKLDRVKRRDHVTRHARPVARASSSRLAPIEN